MQDRSSSSTKLFLALGMTLWVSALTSAASTSVWDSREFFGRSLEESAGDRLANAFAHFTQWQTWIEVLLGAVLAVGLATLLAYHPRGSRHRDRLEAFEERRTLVTLGLVGSVVASLVAIDQAMALVVFGIGGLIRFRTDLASPQVTGRAILVVVIGLAAGLSQYAAALSVAAVGWVVIWWLHAHRFVRLRIRVRHSGHGGTSSSSSAAGGSASAAQVERDRASMLIKSALERMHCSVKAIQPSRSGRNFTVTVRVPSAVADELLCHGVVAGLAPELGTVAAEVREV